jgi:hypothetical protein
VFVTSFECRGVEKLTSCLVGPSEILGKCCNQAMFLQSYQPFRVQSLSTRWGGPKVALRPNERSGWTKLGAVISPGRVQVVVQCERRQSDTKRPGGLSAPFLNVKVSPGDTTCLHSPTSREQQSYIAKVNRWHQLQPSSTLLLERCKQH